MRVVSFAAALLLLTAFSSGTDDLIYWSASKKLSWPDFKGKHDASTGLEAFTYSEIGFVPLPNAVADSLVLKVTCAFNKNMSSVKTGSQKRELLDHEQGHFDIAEVYTRLLRKKIKEAKLTRKNMDALLKSIYKTNFEAFRAEQDKYDTETEHSEVKEKQEAWLKKIALELKDLDTFGPTIVRTKLNN